ncbi:MAG: hypothetical protein MJZ75_04825 [Paludibacteraceae bacterium]|nr:hypothetical protein [Paludibacteraceae bacterium]
MTVSLLKAELQNAITNGYGDYWVHFYDQDGDGVTIDTYYLDNDGDLCLESNEHDDRNYTAKELFAILQKYKHNTYVYIYDDDSDISFDIEDYDDEGNEDADSLWYIGTNDELCLDTYYDDDSTPDYTDNGPHRYVNCIQCGGKAYWDDEEQLYICPNCHWQGGRSFED